MTDKPAAMFGSYVDAKWMRGLKVMRISVDVPIEQSDEFLKLFGPPSGSDPVPVVLARYEGRKPREAHEEVAPSGAEDARQKQSWATMSPSQRAAVKLNDEGFQIWLADTFPTIWDSHYIDRNMLSPDAADATLKEVLGIHSKRDLDGSPVLAESFDKLLASYDYRNAR